MSSGFTLDTARMPSRSGPALDPSFVYLHPALSSGLVQSDLCSSHPEGPCFPTWLKGVESKVPQLNLVTAVYIEGEFTQWPTLGCKNVFIRHHILPGSGSLKFRSSSTNTHIYATTCMKGIGDITILFGYWEASQHNVECALDYKVIIAQPNLFLWPCLWILVISPHSSYTKLHAHY